MIRTGLIAAAMSLGLVGAASATTVTVESAANSSGGGVGLATGFVLAAGDAFQVWANIRDTWSLGNNDPGCTRESNADGLTACFPAYNQGNLTTRYGTLVGQIGSGDFFVVGSHFSGTALTSGELHLYNWDSNTGDNSGSIAAKLGAVPLPAGGLLLLGALGGIAALRRRKSV